MEEKRLIIIKQMLKKFIQMYRREQSIENSLRNIEGFSKKNKALIEEKFGKEILPKDEVANEMYNFLFLNNEENIKLVVDEFCEKYNI